MHHPHLLLLERTEEVFRQPPVEECAVFVHPLHFKIGKLVHFHFWLLGCCHQTLLAVEMEKNTQAVAHFCPFWYVFAWDEHLAHLASVEIHAEVHFAHYLHDVMFA